MASCLGLYIDSNIIKYAKVSKERDTTKVESFGVKFYDKLQDGIKQVIEETFSYKVPIAINLSEEMYEYLNMFSLLNKKDLDKAIRIEFESLCTEKGYNPNVFESRYAVAEHIEDKTKLKVVHVSSNKVELAKRIQQFEKYSLSGIYPMPISITNLADFNKKENAIIVNIEDKTTITTVINETIYDVKVLEQGSQDILSRINLKENSYSKSYEICKDTTIYTSEGRELTEEQTGYLEDIMPTLYTIVGQVQKTINENFEKIDHVYLTGTAALINNIDLYFQEYLEGTKCEVLKPSFIKATPEINIKDYIEVNSAIALGLMGLGQGVTGMNFKTNHFREKLKAFLTIEIGSSSKGEKDKRLVGNLFTNDLKQPLDLIEKRLLRVTASLLLLFIIYTGFSMILADQIGKKEVEAKKAIQYTAQQIQLADQDIQKVNSKTNDYTTMINSLKEANNKINEQNKTRGAIPGLLNQIMYIIPANVQITSIQNTTGRHIEITAQSNNYEYLGFLVAKIRLEPVLNNVISTTGQKENDIITIKIEGDLP